MSSLQKGPWNTKLSSAGLVRWFLVHDIQRHGYILNVIIKVYAYFGKEVISELLQTNDDKVLDKLYAKVWVFFYLILDHF